MEDKQQKFLIVALAYMMKLAVAEGAGDKFSKILIEECSKRELDPVKIVTEDWGKFSPPQGTFLVDFFRDFLTEYLDTYYTFTNKGDLK